VTRRTTMLHATVGGFADWNHVDHEVHRMNVFVLLGSQRPMKSLKSARHSDSDRSVPDVKCKKQNLCLRAQLTERLAGAC